MEDEESILRIIEMIGRENDGTYIDILLPRNVSRKIIAYQSIRQDLILCKDALNKLLNETVDKTTSSCLYYTVIALYGKCFTDATTSKSSKFELKDFGQNNSELLTIHAELMELRHNFVAHRGISKSETIIAYLRLHVKNLTKTVKIKQEKRVKPTKEDITRYLQVIDYLIGLTEKKVYAEGSKVWNHIQSKYKPEMLAALRMVKT
jgi:hypothetical protein